MTRMSLIVTIAAASALAAAAGPAGAEAGGPLALCVAAEADKLDFSGVVSITQPAGATVYARGRLDGPASAQVGPDTRFNLASAGKMFTAVAVAQLVDARRVGLDDPVERYVEGLTPETGRVTVRQLLTHSSGLGNYFTPDNLAAIRQARTTADLLPLVASERPAFTPGSRFAYSNSGFLLLGLVIERASGESYGDYLRRHVFAPAGMTRSGLTPGPATDRAVGLTTMTPPAPDGAGLRSTSPGSQGAPPPGPLRPAPEAALPGGPAGGSYSTAADMQRFLQALLEARLTSTAVLRAMLSTQIVAEPATDRGPERDYGMGLGVGVFDGHRWAGHNGGAPGVNTEAAVYPDDRTAVVVLSARDPPTATALFRRVRTVALGAGCL